MNGLTESENSLLTITLKVITMRLEVITAMVTQVDTEKLRRIRTQAKLTQGDVAKALGYKTPLGYHYIESGRCRLRADQLFILADFLGVEADELLIVRPAATHDARHTSA